MGFVKGEMFYFDLLSPTLIRVWMNLDGFRFGWIIGDFL